MTDDDDLTRRLATILAEAGDALPEPAPGALTAARRRFTRRRRARTATVLTALGVILATTISSLVLRPAPAPVAAPAALNVWALEPVRRNAGLLACIAEQNRGPFAPVHLSTFSGDDYPYALSGGSPDVWENWGGDALARDVASGRAAELTGASSDLFLPSVLAAAQVGGRQYGLPVTGTQPAVLFFHKALFAEAGLQPPRTYAELLTAVDTLAARGTTPIALGGADRWPVLMWLMYLTDRIGGSRVLDDIAARRPGAWRDPAVLEAARMLQQLTRHGAFGSSPGALTVDTATGMLTGGQAAMHLMGSWEYGDIFQQAPAFAAAGLGWVPFPAVAGGAGAPDDLIGIPANYLSAGGAGATREEAVGFVNRTLTDGRFLQGLLAAGEVPAVRDLDPHLTGPHADYARFLHGLAARAPAFTLMWDQALPQPLAGQVKAQADRLVRLSITPEQFVAAMATL